MNNCTNTQATASLLDDICKNIKSGTASITDIIPKITDKFLLRDLTAQLNGYGQFASRTARLLAEYGGEGEEESTLKKISSKFGVIINTIVNPSISGIAEMIAENSADSADIMKKRAVEAEMLNCDPRASTLCKEIAAFELQNSGIMKEYYEK